MFACTLSIHVLILEQIKQISRIKSICNRTPLRHRDTPCEIDYSHASTTSPPCVWLRKSRISDSSYFKPHIHTSKLIEVSAVAVGQLGFAIRRRNQMSKAFSHDPCRCRKTSGIFTNPPMIFSCIRSRVQEKNISTYGFLCITSSSPGAKSLLVAYCRACRRLLAAGAASALPGCMRRCRLVVFTSLSTASSLARAA